MYIERGVSALSQAWHGEGPRGVGGALLSGTLQGKGLDPREVENEAQGSPILADPGLKLLSLTSRVISLPRLITVQLWKVMAT